MTTIAIANNKGGVGKTTTAANLAYGLARTLIQEEEIMGAVLMVDLDPQGHLSDTFGVRAATENMCIGNVLDDPRTLGQNIISVDRRDDGFVRQNLYLIPSSRNLEGVTHDLVLRQVSRRHTDFNLSTVLRDALLPIIDRFRYIILDCPPKLDILKPAVYNLTDYVVVPVKTDYLSFQGAQEHIEDLNTLRERDGELIQARLRWVVPTMYPSRQVLASQVLEDMIKFYGRQSVTQPVPESVDVKEAPLRGCTLFEYAPASKPARAYADLVKKVIQHG